MSKLHVVGIGPGSTEYLTFKAKEVVESSDIIIGSKRALELFRGVEAEKLELGVENMQEMLRFAVTKVCEGKDVSLLSTGDPGFSGVLKPILRLADDLEVDVVPGISSIQMCASKLKLSWDDANIITMHGKGISNQILDTIQNGKPTIILPNHTIEEIAKFLIDNGADLERKVAVCEKMGYPNEKIVISTLKNVLKEDFSYMCVFVIY